MYKVVITDCDLGPCDIERKVLKGMAELYVYQHRDEEQVMKVAEDADGIIVQYAPLTRKVIQSLKKCRVISRYGIGVDCIDVKAATDQGIYVANVTEYCNDEVSDHTIALILACARKIVFLDNCVKSGVWDVKAAAPIFPLRGNILGLLGFGTMARMVSVKAMAFGLNIIACDPYVDSKVMEEYGVEKTDFNNLINKSDILSLHVPLTDKTRNVIGESELKNMKKTAFLVNTARGALIDERALYRALKENWIAGAGIDVVEYEPLNPKNDLLKLNNIIITPHAAFYSVLSLNELKRKAAVEIDRVLKGGVPSSLVNRELLERKQ